MRALAPLLVFLISAVGAAGCGGPKVDLAQGLEVLEVTTGWHDAGVVNGQNKLVPRIDFKLKNVSDQPLVALQVNCVFRRVNETEELGAGFLPITRSNELKPVETTQNLSVKSNFGYTGDEPRAEMLSNSHFVDAKVEVLAKYSNIQWKRIAEYPIERRLLPK
jgi:hypothetical protein